MEVKKRCSGIELTKVFAIMFIVTAHVVQTLEAKNEYITYSDYMINLKHVTTDPQTFALILLFYLGVLGNSIFFLCSAWFLLESKKVNRSKLLTMMLQMWSISFISLAAAYLIKGGGSI